MRIPVALLLSLPVLLSACAAMSPAPRCELTSVPPGAVFGVRHGVDTATYPPKASSGMSGCQRVWYGNRQRPESMEVLATYYYDRGHVRRLVGRVPGGASYDCHYRDGALDEKSSQNPAQCPQAADIEKAQ